MRVPDLRETVGVIMKVYPYASHVLKRHGIDDLLWFSGTALEDACKQMKVDARKVAEEIARDGMEPPKQRSALIYDPASEQQMKAAAAAERAAIEAEFQADEAADVAAAEEAAHRPAPKPEEELPDVGALFKKRPVEAPAEPPRPRRTSRMRADSSDTGAPLPEQKPLTPEELAEQQAKAEAKAKAEAELAASIPDVSSAFRARPVAPPPPPPPDAPPPPTPKGELEIPPKDSGSMLSKIMSWGEPPPE